MLQATGCLPLGAEQLKSYGPGFLQDVLVLTGSTEVKSSSQHGVEGLVRVVDGVKGMATAQQQLTLREFK
jgi:hypothetical protein